MLINLVVGDKIYQLTEKMANATLSLAKDKFISQNVNSIYAVKKDNMVVLLKDVFRDTDAFEKAVTGWKQSGYTCYYTKRKKR